ncbi:MAG: hypothetical protein AAF741_15670 [Bacteroidota bacterium]
MPFWIKYLLETGALAAIAGGAWKAWMQWERVRYQRKMAKQLKGDNHIEQALQSIVNDTPAHYAQVIRIHNGGKEISAGLPLYMTVLHEHTAWGCFPLKESIQKMPVDKSYRNKIAELVERKDVHVAVDDPDFKDNTLQSIWRHMEAKYARSIIISIGQKGIYFLRTTSRTDPIDNPYDLQFRQCISRLKPFYP